MTQGIVVESLWCPWVGWGLGMMVFYQEVYAGIEHTLGYCMSSLQKGKPHRKRLNELCIHSPVYQGCSHHYRLQKSYWLFFMSRKSGNVPLEIIDSIFKIHAVR